ATSPGRPRPSRSSARTSTASSRPTGSKSSGTRSPDAPRDARRPAVARESDRPGRIEAHALALEEPALDPVFGSSAAARADPALRVDDAVPGDAAASRERRERVSHETRLAGQARETRDLAVGRHPAPRDPRNDRRDAREDSVAHSARARYSSASSSFVSR